MGADINRLDNKKEQTIRKSQFQDQPVSQPVDQDNNLENLHLKQLKSIKDLAEASPHAEKLRTFQAMASKQPASQLISPLPAVQNIENENIRDVHGETMTPESQPDKIPDLSDEHHAAASDKPAKFPVSEINNSYNKGGFITEKASLRKTKVVNTIIESNKSDKKKAAKIIKSGVLEKDKGWFGLGLLGVKTEKFELSDNFDPIKLKYLIPVKIDQANEDKELGWTPVQINYDFNEEAKQKLSVYKDEEGYVDSKKLIKSELDLNEKGTALTGKDNAPGAAINDSLIGKIAGFAVNNSKTIRGMANEAVGSALDLFNKGADFIQENALDEVDLLKGLSFNLDKDASKITTQGSFITGKVAKDNWIFSASFKLNTQGDYSAEYMGSVIENPPEVKLESENAGFNLNFGSMVKHQANADDPSIISHGGNASFQIMGQEVFAKWNQLDFNLNEKKVTSADFSEVGLTINLSVEDTIKVENLTASVKDLAISNNLITHGDISLNIDAINLFDVAVFNNIKANIGQKTGLTGEGDFDVTAPGLTGAKGKATVEKGPDDKVATYKLQNGAFGAIIMGQDVSFNGVNYDSIHPNEISAASSNLKLNFSFGEFLKVDEFDATVSNARLTKNEGLTFDNISVNIASVSVFNDTARFSNINGNISPKDGFNATGDFLVTAPDLANASGKVSVQRGPDELLTKYNLENGAFKATILGQEVSVTGVTYDSENPHEISAASSNIKLNFSAGNALQVDDLDATLTDAKLSATGFTYQDITVNIASINVMDIATFSAINGKVNADGGFSGSGNFNVSLPGLGGGQGIVTVKRDQADKTTQYLLRDGSFNVEMVGQKAFINGVSYDSASNIFSIEKGELDLNLLGVNLNIVILNPDISKNNGFDFASATATIPEIVFADEAKIANLVVNIVKDGETYAYSGSSDFNLSGKIDGAAVSADGNVSISNEDGEGPALSFSNANVNLSIFGQSLELKNVNYKDGEFKAEKTVADVTPPFLKKKLQIIVNDLTINKDGYALSKSEIDTQLEVDFGIIKGNLARLVLEKTNENWIISAEGGLAAGGTDFFGQKIPKIEGSGTLSHDFGKKETKKELTGVAATLPDITFPGSIFPGKIGGSAEIPVMPGLNVVASAGMEGKVTVPGLQLRINKKGDQVYLITAGTQEGKPVLGEVKVYLSVGVGTGIPFIASVTVSLGAEGGIFVRLDFNASKEISMEKNENGLSLNSSSMETNYTLSGDLSLAAFLELKATAFYFFSKSFKKELAKRSLGGFEKSKDTEFKWIKSSEPLQNKEETTMDVKEGLKLNLISFENKVWTKDAFVKISSGVFRGSRKRILAVDEALAEYDTYRGVNVHADEKISALNRLSYLVSKYLKETAGTSSRTAEVEALNVQIQNALKELHSVVENELLHE